jgi:hypothetical protein
MLPNCNCWSGFKEDLQGECVCKILNILNELDDS